MILRQGNGSTRELQFKGLPNGLYQPMTPDASQPTATAPQASAPVNTTQEALGQPFSKCKATVNNICVTWALVGTLVKVLKLQNVHHCASK